MNKNNKTTAKLSYQELEKQLQQVQSELVTAKKEAKLNRKLLNATGAIAKVGGWSLDLVTQELTWTKEVYKIHEVAPDFVPTLKNAINFYSPQSREKIENAVKKTMLDGRNYDLDLEIITAKGNKIDVRSKGKVITADAGKKKMLYGTFMDITEAKIKEKAMMTAIHKFRLLAKNTSDWEYWLDENGKFQYISDACERITGYSKEEHIKRPELLQNIVTPKYADLVNKHFEQGHTHKGDTNLEFKIVCKDGSMKWIEHTCNQVIDKDGQYRGRIGNNRDVTARKELEYNSIKLSTAVEQVPVYIVITDLNGEISYVNKAFERITGYLAHEVIGQNPKMLSSGMQDNTFYTELWETIKSGEIWEGEFYNKKKSGELFLEKASITPIKNEEGIITNFLAIKEDITEKRNAELELKESKERFELAMKASKDGLFDWNLETNEIYYSPSWKLMLGYTDAELPNDFEIWKNLIEPSDAANSWAMQQELIHKKRDYFEMEFRMKHKDGRWIDILSRAKAFFNKEGKATRMVGTHTDITYRKNIIKELGKAKEKAEESDRLKSAFLANMSHEIRTPMNGIIGFTQLLQSEDISQSDQKEYAKIIQKSSDRLLNTVNDIIEISKIESGEVTMAIEEIHIAPHLENLILFFKSETVKKGLEISFDNEISESDLILHTDRNKLDSILTNIIKNSIKYTNEGFIKVGLKLKEGNLIFYCQDSGIGIPKNRFEAIFNRFEQADLEDKQAHQGSGLGLAIVKSYVDLLGGAIWLTSEEGKGSIFYVSFPKNSIKTKHYDIPTNKSSLASEKKNINILIAEDDEISMFYLSTITKGIFDHVNFATNGLETIDAIKNDSSINLILMDMKMPEMDGFTATKKIRAFNKDVIIIAQTAFAFKEDVQKAIDAGCFQTY